MGRCHYDVLGVSQDASDEDIKQAFRQKALNTHPDTNPGATAKEFQEVKDAYECLRDPTRRAAYDAFRDTDFSGTYPSTSGRDSFYTQYSREAAGFDSAFERWWARRERERGRMEQEWRDRRSDEQRRAEYMARAAAWEQEKAEAHFVRERGERQRRRMESARQTRAAHTLRRFWQTHQGVTWQDGLFVAVMLGGAAAALTWRPAAKLGSAVPAPVPAAAGEHTGADAANSARKATQ